MPLSGLLKRIANLGSSNSAEPEPETQNSSELQQRDPEEHSRVLVEEPEEVASERTQQSRSPPAPAPAPASGQRQLLAVDTASLGRIRSTGSNNSSGSGAQDGTTAGTNRRLSPSANPGLIFTPATPLEGSPQTATSESIKAKLFGNKSSNSRIRSSSGTGSTSGPRRASSPMKGDNNSNYGSSSSRLHGDAEEEIAPPVQLSASPDSISATATAEVDVEGDLPGIPRSGSPLPMSGGEEDEDDEDEEHELRDAAEAKLEEEEEAKNRVPSPDLRNKPTSMAPFPGRSFLQRLPSQAITDTPSTESGSVRSPMSFGFPSLSRNSSLKTGAGAGSASSSSRHSSRMTSMDRAAATAGRSSSSARSPGPRSPGRNSPAAKISSDYGFPSAAITADPEAIQEEDATSGSGGISELPFPASGNSASGSGSGSTYASHITGSPPSSTSYLDASPHRFASPRRVPSSRQTSTSSTHSVSEYSTPAGFLKHRRNSSQHGREVKETHNAISKDLPNGKRKLNQYILTDDIGRGSFGVVQKAKDVNTGTEYAVKEFSKMRLRKRAQSEMIRRQGRGAAMRRGAVPMRRQPQPRTGQGGNGGDERVQVQEEEDKHSDNDLDLIRSEVAIMKKLDHPNVVKLYEVLDVREDDSIFMVVELCADGPLMSLSMGEEKRPLDEDLSRDYFRQIILAIEYLHCNGIIHRDIKPENILKMSGDQLIKLMDFGVSEIFDKDNVDDPRELKTGGSPAFMAPELCVSHHGKVSGKAADIWAAGVTLYCLVVGRLPFESNLMLDLYDQIRNTPVKIPKELSEPLKDLLKRLLEKDPEQRIKMPDLRDHPWVTIDGHDPLPSTEVNVSSLPEITEDDLAAAIAVPSVSYIVNAVRAASRWKRYAARRTLSDGHHSTDGSLDSSDMSRSCSLEGRRDSGDVGRSTLDKGISPAPWALAQVASGAMQGKAANEDLKHAASFPMSAVDNEKGGNSLPAQRRTTKPSSDSIVDFPDVTTRQSHLDHLSSGIDDTNVETLRYYEDQTGHMLDRSAISSPPSSSRK